MVIENWLQNVTSCQLNKYCLGSCLQMVIQSAYISEITLLADAAETGMTLDNNTSAKALASEKFPEAKPVLVEESVALMVLDAEAAVPETMQEAVSSPGTKTLL